MNGYAVRIECYIFFKLKARDWLAMELEMLSFPKLFSHLSKIRNVSLMPTPTRVTPVSSLSSQTETESYYQESGKSDEESTQRRRKHNKTGTAAKLIISSELSTPKSTTFCRQLSEDGINV